MRPALYYRIQMNPLFSRIGRAVWNLIVATSRRSHPSPLVEDRPLHIYIANHPPASEAKEQLCCAPPWQRVLCQLAGTGGGRLGGSFLNVPCRDAGDVSYEILRVPRYTIVAFPQR